MRVSPWRRFQKIAKLNSCFSEQQHRPLKGLGALLGSLAGTVVHRGWPIGQISYSCHDGYTMAPYVLCTYHVRVRVGAAPCALELRLRKPVVGVDMWVPAVAVTAGRDPVGSPPGHHQGVGAHGAPEGCGSGVDYVGICGVYSDLQLGVELGP